MNLRKLLTVMSLAVAALCAGANPASAGVYVVHACFENGQADGWVSAGGVVDCPAGEGEGLGLGVTSPYATAYQSGRVTFSAPPGASIARMDGDVDIRQANGWHAGVYDFANSRWLFCGPTNNCDEGGFFRAFGFDNFRSPEIGPFLICGQATCAGEGKVLMRRIRMFIEDFTPPEVGIGVPAGWTRGEVAINVDANDNVGIRTAQLSVGGQQRRTEPRACSEFRLVQCPNGRSTFPFNTAQLADGEHVISVDATDSAGNIGTKAAKVLVDNTAPGQLEGISIEGGEGWRASNSFDLRLIPAKVPAGAPNEALLFELCPGTKASGEPGCQRGQRRLADLGGTDEPGQLLVKDVRVPAAGSWSGRFWLCDAAGNQNIETARSLALRFDDRAPDLAFRTLNPSDPTLLRVQASDEHSGVQAGTIEMQRRGEAIWRALDTSLDSSGFSASLDDENLPDGGYLVRARAVDGAGNERSTSAFEDGRTAELALPVRIKTRLVAGRAQRVKIARRPKGSKRRYRTRLRSRTTSTYGRSVRLSGRLTTPGANPVAKTELQVLESVAIPGSALRRIGSVVTSRTGRFSFRVAAGPSRIVRFRYVGTPTVRAATAAVELRVRAASSFSVSRPRVVNGESVTFRGRLSGGYLPPQGKLVALQALSRGRWRPFATTRADARSGRWTYTYRFDGTRGTVRYRFRVRVLREATYPFATGTSRQRRVVVRGVR